MNTKVKTTVSTFNLYTGGSLTIYNNIKKYIHDFGIINFTFKNVYCEYKNDNNFKYVDYPLKNNNSIYRFYIEQLYLPIFAIFNGSQQLIMMGNFPSLLWPFRQKVFFHNLLYLEPKSASLKMRIEKFIFFSFMKLRKPKILVQTNHVKNLLSNSLGFRSNIQVIGFPMESFEYKNTYKNFNGDLILFYPAFGYEHKNHKLLFSISNWLIDNNITIYLTITESDVHSLKINDFNPYPFKFIGNIDYNEIGNIYGKVDGLIFPSRTESLGIPLLEAHIRLLPVIAPNLDYVKSVISNFYGFEMNDAGSLEKCLIKLKDDLSRGKQRLPNSEITLNPEKFFIDLIS